MQMEYLFCKAQNSISLMKAENLPLSIPSPGHQPPAVFHKCLYKRLRISGICFQKNIYTGLCLQAGYCSTSNMGNANNLILQKCLQALTLCIIPILIAARAVAVTSSAIPVHLVLTLF